MGTCRFCIEQDQRGDEEEVEIIRIGLGKPVTRGYPAFFYLRQRYPYLYHLTIKYIDMRSQLLFISLFILPIIIAAQDNTPPVPVLMNFENIQIQGDTMSLPASFFNVGSYDDQTDSSDLRFAYSENVYDSLKTFVCLNTYNQKVEIYVFDTSGNYAHKEIRNKFKYQDCPDTLDVLLPTPYCLNGIATFADSFGVDIPVRLFDVGSFDDQTPSDQLKFSYSEDLSDTIISVDCGDIGQTFEVRIYVHDLKGKSDYCRTYFTVADGEDCESNTSVIGDMDTIPPRLIVLNGISTLVLPRTNIISLRAEDFVVEAFDNVTETENLQFSFSQDTNDIVAYYSCAHEGANIVDIYCFDEAGNWSRIRTYSFLQVRPGEQCEYPDVDTIPPFIQCNTDTLTFYLEEDSVAHIYVEEIIDTIYDDLTSYEDMFLSFDEWHTNGYEEFGCDQLGYHTFNFRATDLRFNSSTCEATIEITDTLGICQLTSVDNEIIVSQIHIYPNPTSDRIHIQSKSGGDLYIIDALGRQVHNEEIRANVPLKLNVREWNKGVHSAVLINSNGNRISSLFIIQ